MSVGVGGFAFENHFAAFEHGSFRDQDDRVAAGILAAVGNQQFAETFDIEFIFGNDTAIRGAGHGGKHGGETRVPAEDFDDHETLMGAGGSAEAVNHLNCACNAGAEADTVVGARDVVVHGLGDADNFESFFVETNAVAQGVIAADGNQRVNTEPGKVLEYFRSEVVFLRGEFVFQVCGDTGLNDAAGIGAGGMEKGAAGAAGAVDSLFIQEKEIVGVVVILFANHIHESGPTVTDSDDLIAFANGAQGDAADGGIETRNIVSSGEDADDSPLGADISHDSRFALSWIPNKKLSTVEEFLGRGEPKATEETSEAEKVIE